MTTINPTDSAVRRLLAYITGHQLEVGHRLPSISELSRKLSMAPHTVRDALLQAQTMGLVRVRPRSGSYVQSVNFGPLVEVFAQSLPRTLAQQDRNLFDLLEARRFIEVELAAMAAGRRRFADLVPLRVALQSMYEQPEDYESYMKQNETFHLTIAEVAGNGVLRDLLQCLLVLLRPTLGDHKPATWKDKGSEKRRRDRREHEAIFQALLDANGNAARLAMTEHLQDTTETLMQVSRVESTASNEKKA